MHHQAVNEALLSASSYVSFQSVDPAKQTENVIQCIY